MNFESAPEFKKDVKKLGKRWRSIPADVKAVEQYILPLYAERSQDVPVKEYRNMFFARGTSAILQLGDGFEVIKMRLDCASLGSNQKVRLVFVALVHEKTVTFIELFSKNDKEREDRRRIQRALRSLRE